MTLTLFFVLSLGAVDAPPPAAAPGDDLVVTARPEGCRIDLADKQLTDQDFDARAKEWAAGKPVRIEARSTESVACLSKIAFKLMDKGVKNITFVDPSGKSGGKFRPVPLPVQGGGGYTSLDDADIRDRERSLLARRVATMILAGRCGEARRYALENGDLDAAAKAAQVCAAPVAGSAAK